MAKENDDIQYIRSRIDLWRDRGLVGEASARGMQKDFSWDAPAAAYVRLYRELVPGV